MLKNSAIRTPQQIFGCSSQGRAVGGACGTNGGEMLREFWWGQLKE